MKLPLRILHDVALLVILNDGERNAAPKVATTFVLAALRGSDTFKIFFIK